MRNLILIAFVAIVATGCGTTIETNSAEQTAESVYKVVLANDADALKSLLLTKEEIEQYMKDNQVGNMEARMAEVNDLYGKLPYPQPGENRWDKERHRLAKHELRVRRRQETPF